MAKVKVLIKKEISRFSKRNLMEIAKPKAGEISNLIELWEEQYSYH